MLGSEVDTQNTSGLQPLPSVQSGAKKSVNPIFLDPGITHQCMNQLLSNLEASSKVGIRIKYQDINIISGFSGKDKYKSSKTYIFSCFFPSYHLFMTALHICISCFSKIKIENFDEKSSLLPVSPLSSTAASVTERRDHGAVMISENKCNSRMLRDLLIKVIFLGISSDLVKLFHQICGKKMNKMQTAVQNMDQTDPVVSKRSIHKAARESMKEDDADIICSDAGFTYIVSTTEYCEAQKEKVICFVYKKS